MRKRQHGLRPHVDFVVVFGIANEDGEHHPRIVPLHRRDLVDAARIEEIQIARLERDLAVRHDMRGRIFVKTALGDIRLYLLGPQTAMQHSLHPRSCGIRVLHTQHTGKLVGKARHLVVEPLFAQNDVVDVRTIGVGLVVDAKDGRAVQVPVALARRLNLLIGSQRLQVPIEQLHRVEQTRKKGSKKRVRLLRICQERLLVAAQVAEAGANVDARALVARSAQQPALGKAFHQPLAIGWRTDLGQQNRRYLRPSQGAERIGARVRPHGPPSGSCVTLWILQWGSFLLAFADALCPILRPVKMLVNIFHVFHRLIGFNIKQRIQHLQPVLV
ncbi:MAG: hypothetical protein F4X51_14785 [Gemmatimonadetes bacterium]|nr:hypothetical protein [Gemmatimonadota bacterium]